MLGIAQDRIVFKDPVCPQNGISNKHHTAEQWGDGGSFGIPDYLVLLRCLVCYGCLYEGPWEHRPCTDPTTAKAELRQEGSSWVPMKAHLTPIRLQGSQRWTEGTLICPLSSVHPQ